MPEGVRQIEWQHLNKFKYFGLQSVFLLGVNTALYPTDLIKTRLQVQRTQHLYKGTLDVLVKTVRLEGGKGLYKGFLVSQLGILTGHLYIASYEVSRAQMSWMGDASRGFVAGGIAAVVEQFVVNPVEVISQRLMIQGQGTGQTKLKSASKIASEVFKEHSLYGFYRGFLASLITGCVWSAVWWGSYGAYLDVLGHYAPEGTSHLLIQGLSGALSGLNSAAVGNPFDIIDTRLKVRKRRTGTIVLRSC